MKISIIQADLFWENISQNLQKFDRLIAQVDDDVEIIILPEMFSTGFTMNIDAFEKPLGKTGFEWLRNKASATGKIVVGSILIEEEGNYYNRMYWMYPDGQFAFYDKRHLFHQGGEDKVMTAGNKSVIVNHKGIKFMLQICYDLRFPVAVRNSYNKTTDSYDYDVIIYIANWPELRQQAYLSLLKARAIENQSYVIWLNRVGADNKKIAHSGDSQLLDAYGNIVAQAKPHQEEVLHFSIDKSSLDVFRKQFQVALDWDKFKI
jgi:predicted amidohydrolase